MVKHRRLRKTYFLNRNYELMWEKEFSAMIPSEEFLIKKYLVKLFNKKKKQEWEGWTPSQEDQMPEKCAGTPASEFTGVWIDDWRKLSAITLAGFLFTSRELIGTETCEQ